MTTTMSPTYMIRSQFGPLPSLDDYGLDVEAATDRYVIFHAPPRKVHALAYEWDVLVCPPGVYPDDTEGAITVNADGTISYAPSLEQASVSAPREFPTGEEYEEPTHWYLEEQWRRDQEAAVVSEQAAAQAWSESLPDDGLPF